MFLNLFKTKNEKILKKYNKKLKEINKLKEKYKNLNDEKLKNEFFNIKNKILEDFNKYKEKNNLNDILLFGMNTSKESKIKYKKEITNILNKYIIDVYAIIREASKRTLNMEHYDVQILGGLAINDGYLIEMKTGEGKTLVATLPVILNSIIYKSFVITVNDYLARRDANLMKNLYDFFDLKVGIIQEQQSIEEKKENYNSDIIYCNNSEFGFDFLRNNTAKRKAEQLFENKFWFAIVDEVDSILIDEARTPLIISEPYDKDKNLYIKANEIVKKLKEEEDFKVDKKEHLVILTDKGYEKIEKLLNIENLYSNQNLKLVHHIQEALNAHYLLEKDKDYLIKFDPNENKEKVYIIDEYTGRISEGRQYSDGLHQAIEAKEGITISDETKSIASITYQSLFLIFTKLTGMSGTIQTEATEFLKIYNLDTLTIPTNKPIIRKDLTDILYITKKEKYKNIINLVKELHKKGQPVLIGTTSVEESEEISNLLKKENINHNVLNAKNHEKEAEIIEKAGEKGAVTVATNMAGRGVDIKINEEVKKLGGLYIIGCSRNENRRIDDQLKGRAGRQGDPGTSRFFISLEDRLIKIFGNKNLIDKIKLIGFKEDEHIESKLIQKLLKSSQETIKKINFEARQNLFKYDQVIDIQRKTIYQLRSKFLNEEIDLKEKINEYLEYVIEFLINKINNLEYNYDENIINEILNEKTNDQEKIYLAIIKYVLKKELNIELEFSFIEKELKEKKLEKFLYSFLKKIIESKFFDLEEKKEILIYIILDTIDNLWIEHLNQIDLLRTGIHLRSFNNKDPLIEFKKESYEIFQKLINDIKFNIIKNLIEFEPENFEIDNFDNFELEKNILLNNINSYLEEEEINSLLPINNNNLETNKLFLMKNNLIFNYL